MADIRFQTLAVLSRLIGPGSPVALLDYPYYPNAGDVLIWAGTRAYLDTLRADVRYQERHDRYSRTELMARHPTGPILLQGGGNFGDRWPAHQEFRERVIADFPDRRIVQLPQTIEMSLATAARIRDVYSAHPDLTVLLRDSASLRAAGSLFPDLHTEFCPDLAFGYSPTSKSARSSVDVIELKRNDSESATSIPLFEHRQDIITMVRDWGLNHREELQWTAIRAPGAVGRRISRHISVLGVRDVPPPYDRFTRLILHAAERTLARGHVVVTDRLHAVVLAALIGIPVVARDNANRKVSTIIEDYLGLFDGVYFATDPADATQHVLSLLQAR